MAKVSSTKINGIWKYCMFKPTVAQILMYSLATGWWHVNTYQKH